MDQVVFGTASGAGAVVFSLLWLEFIGYSSRAKQPLEVDGWRVMRYANGYLAFCGIFLLVVTVSVLGIMFEAPRSRPLEVVLFVVYMFASIVFTYYLLRDAFGTEIRYNDNCIAKKSPFVSTSLPWAEVEKIEYSSTWHALVLTGAGKTLRVSRYTAGFCQLAQEVKNRCASTSHAELSDYLNQLSRELDS